MSALLVALLFLAGTANAQIAVYDVTETGVMVGGGFKSNNQRSVGRFYFNTQTLDLVQVKARLPIWEVTAIAEPVFYYGTIGPKGSTQMLLVLDSYFDPSQDVVLSQRTISGANSVVSLGGRFGTALLPRTASGTGLRCTTIDGNNTVTRSTITARLNLKQTQRYNLLGASINQAANDGLAFYESLGYEVRDLRD